MDFLVVFRIKPGIGITILDQQGFLMFRHPARNPLPHIYTVLLDHLSLFTGRYIEMELTIFGIMQQERTCFRIHQKLAALHDFVQQHGKRFFLGNLL